MNAQPYRGVVIQKAASENTLNTLECFCGGKIFPQCCDYTKNRLVSVDIEGLFGRKQPFNQPQISQLNATDQRWLIALQHVQNTALQRLPQLGHLKCFSGIGLFSAKVLLLTYSPINLVNQLNSAINFTRALQASSQVLRGSFENCSTLLNQFITRLYSILVIKVGL